MVGHHRRLLCGWWLVAFLLCNCTSLAERVTHLRSGAVPGPGFAPGRRALLHARQPCIDPRWTVLCGKQQFLLQLDREPGAAAADPADEAEVLSRLEAHGAVVSSFLPPASWLVLAPPAMAGRATCAHVAHPHALVPLEPSMKVAPELAELAALVQDPSAWAQLAAGAHVRHVAGNASDPETAQQLRARILLGKPHLESHRPRAGDPLAAARLVVGVEFAPLRTSKVSKLAGSGASHDPAAAAAEEWAAPLAALAADGACVPRARASGGKLTVSACPQDLPRVVEWLSQQHPVHWLAPRMAARVHNIVASAITQGARPARGDDLLSLALHPLWAAGLDGEGQVVGIGDSGISMDSCYFTDPKVPFIPNAIDPSGSRVFRSFAHRKVLQYVAVAGGGDFEDDLGHGSHTGGSIAASKYNSTRPDAGTGMAPGAKLSFIDLSRGASEYLAAPDDYGAGYASMSYGVGARIHSDSWGADTVTYDSNAADVDQWTWEHQDFVAVFAAGNYGEAVNYPTTVTTPATSKNCITVGATQTLLGRYNSSLRVPVHQMQVTVSRLGYSDQTLMYRVVQASFGGSMAALLASNASFPLLIASPFDACTPLTGASVAGAWLLVQRGECYYADKLRAAALAGAAGVLITDTAQSGYFVMDAPPGVAVGNLSLPLVGVPLSIGRELLTLLRGSAAAPAAAFVRFAPHNASALPSYEDIAIFSSFGPTLDGRIKPDVVAPGDVLSTRSTTAAAPAAAGGSGACALRRIQGTSMAAPVVAGSIALIRQYFMDGFYPSGAARPTDAHIPSGALLKAVLLGGASNMLGNTEASLPLEPAPSFRQGYGRVNLTRSLPLAGNAAGWRMQVVDGAALSQNASHRYCLTSTGGALSVMLAWYDPPSTPAAASVLINDLDLVVRAAGLGDTRMLGNGWRDTLNPNERVLVDDLPAGPVAITVTARRVVARWAPQKYSLAVLGRFEGALASGANPDPAGASATPLAQDLLCALVGD